MPSPSKITVVGCGVIGLTTALCLQEAGYAVRIVAREQPLETTSAVAAAVWYPYEAYPRKRVTSWSRRTRERLEALARQPDSGVAMTTLVELYDQPVEAPWWEEAAPAYRHPTAEELPPGYTDGYAMEVPLAEAPIYLRYLLERFRSAGGELEVIPEGVHDLSVFTGPDRLAINCTGLGARELVGDDALFPIRGQVVRVTNPGLERCLVDDHGPRAISYVIPRREDCILGGTAEKNAWDLEPSDETTERILRRTRELEPRLHEAEVLEVKVGLRPGRPAVRLERSGQIIHNYGHGGAGFTLAWGCAEEVLRLVGG